MAEYKYRAEVELKNKSLSREEYAGVIASKIAQNSAELETIIKKEKLTEDDLIKIDEIEKNIEYIYSNKILPKVTPIAVTKLNVMKTTLLGAREIFSYVPIGRDALTVDPLIQASNKKYSDADEPGIIVTIPDIDLQPGVAHMAADYVPGVQKYTQGIADDLRGDLQSTLKITKESYVYPGVSSGFLHDRIKIDNLYTVSFKFRINNFPSKVFQDNKDNKYSQAKDRTIKNKKVVTRRSDLITFEYEAKSDFPSKIEFAAMAPFGVNSEESNKLKSKTSNIKNINFDNKFYPFAIAACITNPRTGRKFSVYTDYKFNLGTWYTVSFKIGKNDISKKFTEELNKAFSTATYLDGDGNQKSLRESYYSLLSTQDKEGKVIMNTSQWNACMRSSFIYDGESYTAKRAIKFLKYAEERMGKDIIFGEQSIYNFSMAVNGMTESIASYRGKVWGSSFNKKRKLKQEISAKAADGDIIIIDSKIKRKPSKDTKNNSSLNSIASMPGFKTINFHTVKNRKKIVTFNDVFDCSILKSIYTVPYQIVPNLNTLEDSNLKNFINVDPFDKYKNLYNNYLHRLNHGVDFGEIKISYIPYGSVEVLPEEVPVEAMSANASIEPTDSDPTITPDDPIVTDPNITPDDPVVTDPQPTTDGQEDNTGTMI